MVSAWHAAFLHEIFGFVGVVLAKGALFFRRDLHRY